MIKIKWSYGRTGISTKVNGKKYVISRTSESDPNVGLYINGLMVTTAASHNQLMTAIENGQW
jgi:hypothetical protein